MKPDANGDPSKATHQEIIEEEQGMVNHVIGVLLVCHRIMAIERERS